jgi:hypothetical protein
MKSVVLACVVCLAAFSAAASGGLVITLKTTSGTDVVTTQMQFDATHMRAELASPGASKNVLVFDGTRQVMDVIDVDKKTYTEITKADVDALAAQMNAMMAQVQQRMGAMTPEQRKQVEGLMKGKGAPGAAAAVKPTYKKTGSSTVGKWKCDTYDGYTAERKTSEVCVADPKTLGLSARDFAISAQMADFFAKVNPQRATQMFTIGSAAERGYDGVPLRTVVLRPSGGSTTIEVADISHQDIPASAFALPSGLQKVNSPFAGRGRGR